MSHSLQFYITTILIYFGVDLIAAWGFNLQYGCTAVINLGFIVSQAAGAYICGVTSIGSAAGTGNTYIFGAVLPFPLPIVLGTLAGGIVSLVLGALILPRRLNHGYFATIMLVLASGLVLFIGDYQPIFNGLQGITAVPPPFFSYSAYSVEKYWVLAGITAGFVGFAYWVVNRIENSPLSRVLRAVRDNSASASSIGIAPTRVELMTMGVGGLLGGLSGTLLISVIGAWGPNSWSIFEVFVVLTAVALGGAGNNLGVVLGVLLIPIALAQGITFIPAIGNSPTVNGNLQSALSAVILIGVLWLRPPGLIPERRRDYSHVERRPDQPIFPALGSEAGSLDHQ